MVSITTKLGVSSITGMPRYVICIKSAQGHRNYYFRYREARYRLPKINTREFAAAYSARLVEHGLLREAQQPARPRTLRKSHVYFIQNTETGAIKIGIANWPEGRLAEMQVGNHAELCLLASFLGGRNEERALHERFIAHHIRGEWFQSHPDLMDEIRRV